MRYTVLPSNIDDWTTALAKKSWHHSLSGTRVPTNSFNTKWVHLILYLIGIPFVVCKSRWFFRPESDPWDKWTCNTSAADSGGSMDSPYFQHRRKVGLHNLNKKTNFNDLHIQKKVGWSKPWVIRTGWVIENFVTVCIIFLTFALEYFGIETPMGPIAGRSHSQPNFRSVNNINHGFVWKLTGVPFGLDETLCIT